MSENPAQQLITLGQSIWYDNISRDIIENGDLEKLISGKGVRGITSNPTIFDNAIRGSEMYDATIASLKGSSADEIFEALAIEDIGRAADILKPIYEESNGEDGYVSIEVSPILANDTQATLEEARRLYAKLNRSNIMIKIPGTPEGIPAVKAAIEEGINVNVTLLFSVENYIAVAEAYCAGLRARAEKGESVEGIRSVASFFVSRVDAAIDAQLEAIGSDEAKALMGKFGVANSRVAYQRYLNIFESDSFADLKGKGAAVQRPLWASTSTKSPAYRDVIYVEELIGANTVNTMPPKTLDAFADHGIAEARLTNDVAEAETTASKLEAVGIDVNGTLLKLQTEGVSKFIDSFKALNAAIEEKATKLADAA